MNLARIEMSLRTAASLHAQCDGNRSDNLSVLGIGQRLRVVNNIVLYVKGNEQKHKTIDRPPT